MEEFDWNEFANQPLPKMIKQSEILYKEITESLEELK